MVSSDQLVFFFGIPGSGWAKIDSLLRCCSKFKFNKSDYREDRRQEVRGTRYYVEHKGHFLGPGTEFGSGFDNIEKNYSKEEFIQECLRPYVNINDKDFYMIKCHWFCEKHNLEWLDYHFPNNKKIFVLRDKDLCNHRWLESMTFAKDYPKYTAWMVKDDPDEKLGIGNHCQENETNFCSINSRHNIAIREYIAKTKNPCIISIPTKYTLSKLGFIWDQEGNVEYRAFITNYCVQSSIFSVSPSWDTSIAFINCQDVIDLV
jgi:hypothetical protein